MIDWLFQNKEWLFSGSAVVVLVWIVNLFKLIKRRRFSNKYSLAGKWQERWWVSSENYPSSNEDPNVVMKQKGNRICATLYSGGRAHKIDAVISPQRFLTGTWGNVENGDTYHGSFQLRISPKWDTMEGIWLGFDTDNGFKSGKWQWKRPHISEYPDRIPYSTITNPAKSRPFRESEQRRTSTRGLFGSGKGWFKMSDDFDEPLNFDEIYETGVEPADS